MKTSTMRLVTITVRCPAEMPGEVFEQIMLDLNETHGISGQFEYGSTFCIDGSSSLHLWRVGSNRKPRVLRELIAMSEAQQERKKPRGRSRDRRIH